MLPDPFRGVGAWKNSTETQQSGHDPRSGPEVKKWKFLYQRLAASTWWCGPRPLTKSGPKWRDNYPEGSNHPVAPQSSGENNFEKVADS